MKRIEYIDHTADIVVRANGDSVEDAFAAAAEALFAVITDHAEIAGRTDLIFTVESIDIEGLLVGLLSELIVRHEVDSIVGSDFSITFEGDTTLTCRCKTEPFDRACHADGIHVKGVSYHLMEIHDGATSNPHAGSYVQVLFDI